MTKGERQEAMNEALTLSAKGKTVQFIADHLGVAWNTASGLIDDAIANNSEHRSADKERERAIANYRAIIDHGWERLDGLKSTSNNVTGVLNAIRAAQEAIDNLSGAKAPIKYQDVSDTFEIVFDDDFIQAGG